MRIFKVSFLVLGEPEERLSFKPGLWVFTQKRTEVPRWVVSSMAHNGTYEYRRFGEYNEYIFEASITEEVIDDLFGAYVCADGEHD